MSEQEDNTFEPITSIAQEAPEVSEVATGPATTTISLTAMLTLPVGYLSDIEGNVSLMRMYINELAEELHGVVATLDVR